MKNSKILELISEGEFACVAGAEKEQNPYDDDTTYSVWWLFGWTKAYLDYVETKLKENKLTCAEKIAILRAEVV
jgi:ribosome modulation factor